MYNHNKAQQSKNRVHISWDILYMVRIIDMLPFQGIWGSTFHHEALASNLTALFDKIELCILFLRITSILE